MLIRNVLLAALVVAPFLSSPESVTAQSRGDHGKAVGFARVHEAPGHAKQTATKRPFARPFGIAKVFDGRTAPPGIRRRLARAETPSAPEAPTEPPPPSQDDTTPTEDCAVDIGFDDNGMLVYIDCNGNVVDGPGME